MNIKKNVMKTMCAALAYTTIMGNMFAAFATDAIVTEAPLDSDGGGKTGQQMKEALKRLK